MYKILVIVCIGWSFLAQAGTIASGDDCGDDCHWTISDDGTLSITGTGDTYNYGPDDSIESQDLIPQTYKPWHAYREQIKNIVVGDGITSLGTRLFQFMPNAETITISDTVTSFGLFVMGHMDELREVKMPSSFSLRGDGAMYDQLFNYNPKLANVYCSENNVEACSRILQNSVDSTIEQASLFVKNDDGSISYYQNKNGTWSLTKKKHARIYTVEEARQAVEAAGTDTVRFRIRYK
ncbi:MAG: hypothetical protein J6X42_04250 [Alphaproteobacteria bacterium]|nr:hypothetical protein [Alphaproteobacteria bacterium]